MLEINLKNGALIQISEFDLISFVDTQGIREIKKEKIGSFVINPNNTYHFIGDRTISVMGNDILFLELQN